MAKKTRVEVAQTDKINDIVAQVEKIMGKGTVVRLGSSEVPDIPSVSTGSVGLDKALGIGGLPLGRIVEIYGPESSGKTTLTLHVIAAAQALGLNCAFVDAEHALDVAYARALGVNTADLMISQPDYGEQALNIVDVLARTGGLGVIVVDSVAALTPKAELDGEVGDHHVGVQARMMSQTLRKLTATANSTDTLIIFINQIRMKIGVMFGCFHYDARVVLEDGTTAKIGKVVNGRLPVRVRTFDPKTGEVGSAPVIEWHTNGKTQSWLKFTAAKAGGNGRTQFKVTPNHMLFMPGMVERAAGDIVPGDEILVQGDFAFNADQRALALAQVLGDGSVRRYGLTSQLRVGHGDDQKDYARWKASVFGELVGWDNDGTHFELSPTCDLTDVEDGPELIDEGGVRAVAIWAMDDGTFSGSFARWGQGKFELCCKRWTPAQREAGADALERVLGVRPTVTAKGFLWSGGRTRALMERIAEAVPECMSRKVHPKFRHLCGRYSWDSAPNRRVELVPAEVLDVTEVPAGKKTARFDLTVEGTHTYLVDGAAVHNSPETTTGGNALKFYSSVRLDIRRIGKIKQGEEIVGNRTRVKVVKNKVSPPFKQAEFDIVYGEGISSEGELIDYGVEAGVIDKAGAWLSFAGDRIGQGRENAKAFLREHPDVADAIRAALTAE